MASEDVKGGQPPAYEPVLTVEALEKFDSKTPAALEEARPPTPSSKMTFLRRTILVLGLIWLVLFGLAMAGPHARWQHAPCHLGQEVEQQAASGEASADSPSFRALLDTASPQSLHDLLHRYLPKQFQHGVWPSERQAVEAVHQADAALATTIVQLARRQDSNSTSISTESSTSSTSSTPTSSTSSSTSTTPSSTPSATSTTSTSSSSTSTSSSSTPTPTGMSSSPTGQTPFPSSPLSETSRAGSSSSSRSQSVSSSIGGDTTLTTSTVSETETSETTSSSRTRSPTSTGTVTSTFTRTSNGVLITLTQTATILYDPPITSSVDSSRPTPGLQNGAPQQQQQRGSLLAGVIGAAMAVMLA